LPEEIKIIIADDHPIFRSGLKQIISEDGNIKVVAEAGDGEQTIKLINELSPDIAVIDVDMPKKNGLEVLKYVSASKGKTKIIFLTMYKEQDMFNEAMDRGIMGYVLKESAMSDIVECINNVFQNRHYISPLISDHLISRNAKINELQSNNPLLKDLTPTERKILKMIAESKTSKEISAELFISFRTVENHRTNISSKLNLHGSHSLLKFAIENKSLL
jgi:DNA-binding NarL/FixJ family response regulator